MNTSLILINTSFKQKGDAPLSASPFLILPFHYIYTCVLGGKPWTG